MTLPQRIAHEFPRFGDTTVFAIKLGALGIIAVLAVFCLWALRRLPSTLLHARRGITEFRRALTVPREDDPTRSS
jgi:hypothetical protein